MFSTRVLQTVSLVSGLDSRILIRLGALRYVTAMLLRRWAWLILSDPVTSSRIRPMVSGSLATLHTRVPITTATTCDESLIFTRGQFWPSGIVIACVCGSVCVCINHELVRSITHHPVKLGSPNLDQRCKTPWFGSLLFLGMIDLDLQGQL